MRDPGADQPVSSSVQAGQVLLGYGWGKPPQPVTGADGEGDISITVRHILEGKK